jgi:hypothetical protein
MIGRLDGEYERVPSRVTATLWTRLARVTTMFAAAARKMETAWLSSRRIGSGRAVGVVQALMA